MHVPALEQRVPLEGRDLADLGLFKPAITYQNLRSTILGSINGISFGTGISRRK
jgi:hypothetical protein